MRIYLVITWLWSKISLICNLKFKRGIETRVLKGDKLNMNVFCMYNNCTLNIAIDSAHWLVITLNMFINTISILFVYVDVLANFDISQFETTQIGWNH